MLPTFLIVGAMKAGTTTLYRDLQAQSNIFFPVEKEPGCLNTDEVLGTVGHARYEALFSNAWPSQARGEATTTYAAYPHVQAVPERARQVLGESLKVVYIVRDPLARIRSHHQHQYVHGRVQEDINEEIHDNPAYIDYTRYGLQAQLWISQFGAERVMILQFEEYIKHRQSTISKICDFLGVPWYPEPIDEHAGYNAARQLPVLTGGWRRLQKSTVYQNIIRPHMGPGTRERVRRVVLPSPRVAETEVTAETVDYVRGRLNSDLKHLAALAPGITETWTLG